MTVSFNCH